MKCIVNNIAKFLSLLLITLASSLTAQAATNEATDPSGLFTSSGNVTVDSAILQLVKQVWSSDGSTCLASSPADAACNSSATTVSVPTNTAIKFLIYAANISDIALNDLRFQDVLDTTVTGFTYTASSITFDNTQTDVATAATIFAAADGGGGLTDLVSTADAASENSGTITVGAVAGQVNQTTILPARTTFAIVFTAVKN